MVAVHKATGKAHNKKLRRRRDGLSTKCFEYGELDGAEQALFIRYPKRGEFYAHVSRRGLPWLQDVPVMMSHAKARVEYPEDLRARVEDARRKIQEHDCTPDTVSAPGSKNPPTAAAPAISIIFVMKSCDHTGWLGICARSGRSALAQSDRPATTVDGLPSPDSQRPSLFVLVGNAEKSIALQAVFGTKKARRCVVKQRHSEIHLRLDPARTFTNRPVLLASCAMRQRPAGWISAKRDRCHRETRHVFRQRVSAGGGTIDELLLYLVFPLADVFCFFSDDLGGFRPIARRLALWLDQSRSPAPPKTALPSVLIVTSKLSPGAEAKERAKRAFLCMLKAETAVSPFEQLSAIDVVACRVVGV
ncbi:hypothetical protein E8E12_002120 [Didymella heteroderae]|uniref:Uncharacterized protein n=1 Tax=Didymella heteroderae TaxID=1769908 RepID=A0A9P4WGC5_9PLEO|nr:hypothetical protein E8E12_002120 [Didymella heteroderae]